MQSKQKFPERIRNLRVKRGLSVAALAREAGVTITTVRKWETGKSLPRIDHAEYAASALSVSLMQLWQGSSESEPHSSETTAEIQETELEVSEAPPTPLGELEDEDAAPALPERPEVTQQADLKAASNLLQELLPAIRGIQLALRSISNKR